MQPIVKANSDIHDLTKLSLQQILKLKKGKLLLDLKNPELENNFLKQKHSILSIH